MVKTIGKGAGKIGFQMLIGMFVAVAVHYTQKLLIPILDRKLAVKDDDEEDVQPVSRTAERPYGGAQYPSQARARPAAHQDS